MSNLDNVQRRLAEGTSSWLLFEFNCKRGDLFSEKYLATPIGQILAGLFPGRIKAEINHPALISTKQAGRPPQLDFVVINEADEWEATIESKWVTSTPISLALIIWDLLRLEILVYKNLCKNTYFVLSGFSKKMDFLKETHFYDSSNRSTSLITQMKSQSIYLDLTKLDSKIKSKINEKINKYPGLTIPQVMRFDLPHSFPINQINMTFRTIVWKVNTFNKRPRIRTL
jgi:hypothetical protein